MRKPAIALCLAAALGAGPVAAADAAPLVDQLTWTVKDCLERKDPPACERKLFAFADATKDGKLSKAEISRALRWLAAAGQEFVKKEMADRPLPPDAVTHLAALQVYAALVGPYLADGIIYNFDYDGDGLVAKSEIYLDTKEGELDKAIMAMVETGQDLAKGAMSMAAKGGIPGLGAKPGAGAKPEMAAAPPAPAWRSATSGRRAATATP
ncbi:MAG: hypothetical protein OXR84_17045 [Magnetovibrio sp.]|nr:hypothetical protein [Magnetovibrio sp.]